MCGFFLSFSILVFVCFLFSMSIESFPFMSVSLSISLLCDTSYNSRELCILCYVSVMILHFASMSVNGMLFRLFMSCCSFMSKIVTVLYTTGKLCTHADTGFSVFLCVDGGVY